ncbi:hypothetical protein BOX15_Mlig029531g6 [Macrostomum lignano]|uniref:Uncharacterized protein n=2 Tax=Macrostomum lignano TaxID=282301 RepID=A0A267GLC4_9PLAT|nr:hypothetical protein BOX15_Mlig029531g4 [Macrostomum lignano]PAA86823.1 hypothetical protein BOX15_Mlig029531g2 [Macrostomum lignano]PAA92398.1 hypothetical protein BOX15_Mlig029531g6 [Macrostomum lignano]
MKLTGSIGKLYELRTYRIAAQDLPRMRSLVQEVFRVRVRHSRIVGYWSAELGSLNQVFHIWEYDSLTARKAIRDALTLDQDWNNKFLKLALPAFEKQDNCVAKSLLGDIKSVWNDQDFYKVLAVNYQGLAQEDARKRFLKSVQQLQQQGPDVKGAFETVIGNSREFYVMHSSNDLDQLIGGEEALTGDPTAATTSKVLNPLQWTRWLKD